MSKRRVVVLGAGFGRSVQAPSFQRHAEFELVAITGSNPEKTARMAAELGLGETESDWRSLVSRMKPDLVSVATPVDLHHPMMLHALACGAHVLCEKPTALHRFQAAEMRDTAARLGRVAAINHEFRFFPARRLALSLVRAGSIGAVRRIEILGRYPIWSTPATRGMSWLSDRRRGGGILGALGSHHTDGMRTLLGEPESVLASARVDQPWRGPTSSQPARERATADDAVTLEYCFAGGATGLIDLNASAPYRWERFEIHGAEASLRWDESGYALWRITNGHEPEKLEIPAEFRLAPREGEPALIAPFSRLLDDLAPALRGTRAMEPNFDDAVAVQSALDAARASSEAGARVAVRIPEPVTAAHSGG